MPNITIPIVDTYNSITRPVAMSIAKDVRRLCMIDERTPLRIGGERAVTSQPGTDGSDAHFRFESGDRLEATVDERLRSNMLLANSIRRNDVTPTLYDKELGVILRTIYLQHDLTFNFRYVASSKAAAERWIKEIAVRIAEGRAAIQHTVEYDLIINDNLLGVLGDIHTLRETVAGYGQSFHEWFTQIQVRDIQLRTMLNGNVTSGTVVAPERQNHTVGWFEIGDVPQETKEDGDITWSVEFSYKFSYQKPMKWQLVYPLLVHQGHVSHYDDEPRYSVDHLNNEAASVTQRAFDRIRWMSAGRSPESPGGLRWPFYDDWYQPKGPFEYTQPVITWLEQILPSDPQLVQDLFQLGEFDFTPAMVQYLKACGAKVTQRGQSLILFTLYEGDNPLSPDSLTMTEDLVIRATRPLSLRKMYHLRLSILTAYHLLSGQSMQTLSEHPYATLEILQTLLPSLDVEWALKYAMRDGVLSKDYVIWALYQAETMGIGITDHRLLTVNRKIYREPIPMVEGKRPSERSTGVPEMIAKRDPGEYKGRNTPPPQEPVAFSLFSEDELSTKPSVVTEIATAVDRSMSPGIDERYPILNNYRAMQTTQYLAIFAAKSGSVS